MKQHHLAEEQRMEEIWSEQQRMKGIQSTEKDLGNTTEGQLINESITSGESVSIKGMSPVPNEEQSQSDNINATQIIGHDSSHTDPDIGSISLIPKNDNNDDTNKEITKENQNKVDISQDIATVNDNPKENVNEDITEILQEESRELLVLNMDKRRSPSDLQDTNAGHPFIIKDSPSSAQ